MCSLITDSVSLMTGESALNVCVRAFRLGVPIVEVRSAVCMAVGGCWLAGRMDCTVAEPAERCRWTVGDAAGETSAAARARALGLTFARHATRLLLRSRRIERALRRGGGIHCYPSAHLHLYLHLHLMIVGISHLPETAPSHHSPDVGPETSHPQNRRPARSTLSGRPWPSSTRPRSGRRSRGSPGACCPVLPCLGGRRCVWASWRRRAVTAAVAARKGSECVCAAYIGGDEVYAIALSHRHLVLDLNGTESRRVLVHMRKLRRAVLRSAPRKVHG